MPAALRSILAVLAGITVLTILSFAIEAAVKPLLPNSSGMPTDGPAWLITTAYTLACVAAGGYATAWIASCSRAGHAVVMGVLQALMTIGVWFTLPEAAPSWRWIVGIALITPAAWLGGTLRRNG